MNNYKLPLITTTISFFVWFGLYFGLYSIGWPGEAHPCSNPPYCFCETVYAGTLAAQKSNTWSDLGFVLAAFLIAWHGGKHLKNTQPAKAKEFRYSSSTLLISLYSSVILFMGPGSMFFHGSMKLWGGYMDVISMYLFVLFIICYLVYRTWNLNIKAFTFPYLILTTSAIAMAVFAHDLSSVVFRYVAIALVSIALIQIIPITKISLGRKFDLGLNHKWLAASLGFFGTAVIIWYFSGSGMSLCYPDSLVQGHAAWHILSACMTICIHFYFLSESIDSNLKS